MKKLKNWWVSFKSENWLSHIITFVGTILGIIVGLQMENSISEKRDYEKVEAYKKLVDLELLNNQKYFIVSKNEYKAAYELLSFIRKERLQSPFSAPTEKIDSLINIDDLFKSMIIILKQNQGKTDFSIEINFATNPIITQAWEAFKISGLLNELDPMTVLMYSRTYVVINTNIFNKDFKSIFFEEFLKAVTDKKLSESELDKLIEQLESVRLEVDIKIENINQCLQAKDGRFPSLPDSLMIFEHEEAPISNL